MSAAARYRRLRRRVARSTMGMWVRRALRRPSVWPSTEWAEKAGLVFIVGEPNRRLFYQEWLDWVAVNDTRLNARLRLGTLPAEPPPHTRLLHAWVQDPVLERSEEVFAQLEALEAQARRLGAGVIHPARVLSNSRRDVMYERLTAAGLTTPVVVDVGPHFAEDLAGLSYPFVLRKSWGHIAPMHLMESPGDLTEWFAEHGPEPQGWVAADYIDVRGDDGLYRKYRYILFGDRGDSRHLIVSETWEVRHKHRMLTPAAIAEELEYVNSPCPLHERFDEARRSLEFDIAAFDFSFTPDGELVVWEVNPYPTLGTATGPVCEHLDDAVARAHRTMAEFYYDRLGERPKWGKTASRV